MKTIVLGTSSNSQKYSYRAVEMLLEYGHEVIPVHSSGKEVCGVKTVRSLKDVTLPVHTITLYLGSANSAPLHEEIFAFQPTRIIFNPGAESSELLRSAEDQGIETVVGCTLVMLRTHNF